MRFGGLVVVRHCGRRAAVAPMAAIAAAVRWAAGGAATLDDGIVDAEAFLRPSRFVEPDDQAAPDDLDCERPDPRP